MYNYRKYIHIQTYKCKYMGILLYIHLYLLFFLSRIDRKVIKLILKSKSPIPILIFIEVLDNSWLVSIYNNKCEYELEIL